MAIQGNYKFEDTGLEVGNAYVKIRSFAVKHKSFISFKVNVYSDKMKGPISPPLEFRLQYGDDLFNNFFSESVLKLADNSEYTQAYKYLKTLDQFSVMSDV
jgi:hypothetical protein